MNPPRRSLMIYGLLAAIWLTIVGWQAEEHLRVRDVARSDLRNRSREIANTLSAIIRGMRFRGTILTERLTPVLNELVNGRAKELVKSSELISIVLLNATNEPVAAAGAPVDLTEILPGERWDRHTVTLVNPVDLGASLSSEGSTNPTVVLPPIGDFTNAPGEGFRDRPPPRSEPQSASGDSNVVGHIASGDPRPDGGRPADGPPPPPPENEGRRRDGEFRPPRRPIWLRGMDEKEYQLLVQKRALHGLVLALSIDPLNAAITSDLWLRSIILLLATFSVLGAGLAWRNLAKSSDLQIRLIRASELNTHLKEMNLAAAGLAHETRNPLNIIRGLAQLISKQVETGPEVRQKSLDIVNEADKVAAQLNEFINYSRPREVRRAVLALNSVVNEVVRTLGYDLEEKRIRVQVSSDSVMVEADEQLLRQALFNLLLNAVQAVQPGGEIQVVAQRVNATEALLDVRDNGPGVPPEQRAEIFKPYFTMQEKGTGLGLAVVQQIVLAHGWEIHCLANEPRGAVFRITHVKLA